MARISALVVCLLTLTVSLLPLYGAAPASPGGGGRARVDDNWVVTWVNPVPTASDLNAVAWRPNGGHALIAGQRGAAFRYNGSAFEQVVTGTGSDLMGIGWMPNGSSALVVGRGGTVLRYTSAGMTTVATGFADLNGVDWRPDGSYALLAGNAGALIKYDGAFNTITTGVTQNLYGVAWAPNGSYALAVGDAGRVVRYDGSSVWTYTQVTGNRLYAVAWAPNGSYALIGGATGTVLRFDPVNGLSTLTSGTLQDVRSIAFRQDGSYAILAARGGALLRYSPSAGFVAVTTGTTEDLRGATWELDSNYAVVVGTAGTVLKYDGTGVAAASDYTIDYDWNGIAWHPSGNTALLVGMGGRAAVYNVSTGKFTVLNTGTNSDLFAAEWRPQGDYAIIVGSLIALKYDGSAVTTVFTGGGQDYLDINWTPAGDIAYIPTTNGNLHRYSNAAGFGYVTNFGTGNDLTGIDYVPGGNYFLVSAQGGEVYRMASPPGAVNRLRQGGQDLNDVAVAPNESVALAVGRQSSMYRNSPTGSGTFNQYTPNPVRDMNGADWRNDSSYALIAARQGALFKFENATATTTAITTTTGEDLQAVAWRPQGDYALIAGFAGVVLKWGPPAAVRSNGAPVAAISSPAESAALNGTVTVTGTAADPDAGDRVTVVYISVDSGQWVRVAGTVAWSLQWNTSLVSDGRHTLTAVAYDTEALPSLPVTVNVTVNNTLLNRPPVVAITSPLNGATVSGTVAVTGTAADPDAGDAVATVFVQIDGGGWEAANGTTAWTYQLNTSLHANGPHTIGARATDTRLNFSSVYSIVVNISNPVNRPPLVAITSPLAGYSLTGTVTITGTASDPDAGDSVSKVYIRFDNETQWRAVVGTSSWAHTWDTFLMDNGPHTVRAVAMDDSLTPSAEASVQVTVDNPNLPPLVTILSPADGATVSGTIVVSGNASDPNWGGKVVWVKVRMDDGEWNTAVETLLWTHLWNTTTIPNGPHRLSAIASDGFQNSTAHTITVNVSNAASLAPVAVIDTIMPANPEKGQNITFTGHGTDDGTVVAYEWRSSLDGVLGSGSSITTANLSVGTHTIYFKVQDNSGIWSAEVTATLTVKVPPSLLPPLKADAGPDRTVRTGDSVKFTGLVNLTPGGGVTVALFQWSFGDGTPDWSGNISGNTTHIFSVPGTFVVTFKVTDSLGRVATDEATVTVKSKKSGGTAEPASSNILPLAFGMIIVLLIAVIAYLVLRRRGGESEPLPSPEPSPEAPPAVAEGDAAPPEERAP